MKSLNICSRSRIFSTPRNRSSLPCLAVKSLNDDLANNGLMQTNDAKTILAALPWTKLLSTTTNRSLKNCCHCCCSVYRTHHTLQATCHSETSNLHSRTNFLNTSVLNRIHLSKSALKTVLLRPAFYIF